MGQWMWNTDLIKIIVLNSMVHFCEDIFVNNKKALETISSVCYSRFQSDRVGNLGTNDCRERVHSDYSCMANLGTHL